MGRLVLDEPLASELQQVAEADNVSIEIWLRDAIKRARWEARRKKVHSETEWWYSLPISERAAYEGQYVAVVDKQVVDHDSDENTLYVRTRGIFPNKLVLITPADKMREIRVTSFRLVQ